MQMRNLHIRNVHVGPAAPLAVIAGPCAAESRELCLRVGEALRDRCAALGFGYIFKASFDKANRSSIHSERGPGLDEGLKLLADVGRELGVPVTTDVHEPAQAAAVAQAVDLLQIPAFLCRQTDLLLAAAGTGRAVNVKKGQFVSPPEMVHVVRKLEEGFAEKATSAKPPFGSEPQGRRQAAGGGIIVTERGTFFGYHRLVNDFVGVGDLMELGWPVCFDVTHSTQLPGSSQTTGGRPERAPLLARCAVAAGVQALFLETHPEPARALSDAATMLPLPVTLELLGELARLRSALALPA